MAKSPRRRCRQFAKGILHSRESLCTLDSSGSRPREPCLAVPCGTSPGPALNVRYMAKISDTYQRWPGITRWLFAWVLLPSVLAAPRITGQSPADGVAGKADPAPDPIFQQVIVHQEHCEKELDEFERVQREEVRKTDTGSIERKTWRLFPTGTGVNKIALSEDGQPLSPESYRSDLEKLEKYLAWVIQDGASQKEAYLKAEHKRKERFDLLEATYQAFIFTSEGKELRNGRTLLRYNIKPNPSYRPTTRNTTLFTRVQGTAWIDEQTSQLAKIDGTVMQDISIALFLAKVYKGSHFMQERYEVAPGVWEPTFEQYDFDGRKFLYPFSIHERTFYSEYKRVGSPNESVEIVRAELSKLRPEASTH
jgi:hypothetical protein